MASRMTARRFFGSLVTVAALLGPVSAQAMTCEEILNLTNLGIPSTIVIQTMQNSGKRFTSSDIACIEKGGAPADVIAAAKNLSSKAAEPAPAPISRPNPEPSPSPRPSPVADPEPSDTFEAATGGDSAGSDEETKGPAKLEALIEAYRAKKYLTASKGLFDLLEEKAFPEEESKIQYYLAKSLYDLGMYHSAQHYFMQVVRRGPKNPHFKYALPRLVAIAQYTGNNYELSRIVHKIPPENFPRQAKSDLYYLMGVKLYEDKDLAGASKYFSQVSSKSDLYLRAKYYEGVINNEREKFKSAVSAFREVYQAEVTLSDSTSSQEIEDLKDLALINISRIYFQLERLDNADAYYKQVDRKSTYWPESLFERAWTTFHRTDLNGTLGLLLTVDSPYYSEDEFIPEVTILRSLAFFNLCEYKEVERILKRFDGDYKPMEVEIKAFLEQYKDAGADLSDQAFDAYFANDHKKSRLKKSLFTRVLRNRELSALVSHLDLLTNEIAMIDQQKGAWKDSLGESLRKQIQEDRVRYKKKAGRVLLGALANEYTNLKDLLGQSQIIGFEVVDAQRVDYEYKMTSAAVDSEEAKLTDFATSKDIIYWPFNGEFWQDELGYYRYAETGSCR